MFVSYILIGIGFLTFIWYVVEKIKGESIKSVIVKGLVSTLFVSVGIYNVLANQISDMPLRFLILLGLIFGLSGDIFLGLKHVYKDKDELFTYLGFITFALVIAAI